MAIMNEVYEYDRQGRMTYHEDFHENQGESWSEYELEYLCKFHKIDGVETMAMGLGRTQSTVASKLTYLRKRGMYEYYKRLNKYW